MTVIPNSRNILQINEAVLQNSQTFVPSIPLKGIRVLSIGRLTEQKDPLTIVKAVQALKEQCKLSLVLVGDGVLMKELKNIIETEEMDNMFLVGYDPDPLKWLACADIFILNSVSEGLPGALIEAMAAGLPCIATDIPGNRELVINKRTGLLIPVHDQQALMNAISYLVDQPQEAKQFAANGFSHVLNQYDSSVEQSKWLTLFNTI